MMLMFIGGLIVPLFLIIYFYSRIWFMIRSNKMYLNSFYNVASYNCHNQEIVLNQHNEFYYLIKLNSIKNSVRSQEITKKELKLLRTIFKIIVMFCFAWIPYALLTLVAQFGSNIHYYVTPFTSQLPAVLAKMSSVYYPFVFILSNRKCKLFVKNFFLTKSDKKNDSSIF